MEEMLTEKEKQWLEKNNSFCLEKMKGYITDPEVLTWLEKQAERTKF